VPRPRPGKARPRRLVSVIFSLLFLVVQWAFSSLSPRLNLFRDDPIVWRMFGLAGAARDHAAALNRAGRGRCRPRDGAAAARCRPRAARRAPDPPPASDAFRDLASSIDG